MKVEPDLTVPGHPDVFAIGDTVTIAGPDGNPVPGIAPAAKQQGRYVAALIKARLNGRTLPPFRYKHAGSLAQIGKRKAVIDFGWMMTIGLVLAFASTYTLFPALLVLTRRKPLARPRSRRSSSRPRSWKKLGAVPPRSVSWR